MRFLTAGSSKPDYGRSVETDTVTKTPTALIQAEHGEIRKHLIDLGTLAERAERMTDAEFGATINRVVAFLQNKLLPHARVEEAVLYPVLDDLLRRGGATRTMAIDHGAVAAMVNELEEFRHAAASEVVRHNLANLCAKLEAVLRIHFQKEEQVYVPLLANLSADASRSLANSLETEAPQRAGR